MDTRNIDHNAGRTRRARRRIVRIRTVSRLLWKKLKRVACLLGTSTRSQFIAGETDAALLGNLLYVVIILVGSIENIR